MERDVMDIIRDKEFIELTAAERAELNEMCSSEEEFDQVKSMLVGMSAINWSNPTPKAETKASLDHLFAQQHPKVAPIWYNAPLAILVPKGKPFYRQPLVQAAAVGLLIFLAYPLVNSNEMAPNTNQVAELEEDMTSSKAKEGKSVAEEDVENTTGTSTNEVEKTVIESSSVTAQSKSEPMNDLGREIATQATPVSAPSMDVMTAASAVSARESEHLSATLVGAAKPGSTHPDGIFIEDRAEVFSAPASREPAVFDLLTSTF